MGFTPSEMVFGSHHGPTLYFFDSYSQTLGIAANQNSTRPTAVVTELVKPIENTWRQNAWNWVYDHPLETAGIAIGGAAVIAGVIVLAIVAAPYVLAAAATLGPIIFQITHQLSTIVQKAPAYWHPVIVFESAKETQGGSMTKVKKSICLIITFLIIIGVTGCAEVQLIPSQSPVQSKASSNIPNMAQNTSGGGVTTEYIMPQELFDILGRTPDEVLHDMRGSEVPNLYTDMWINSQGTLTLLITEEQRQNWLENSEKIMNEYIDSALENGFMIQVSEKKDRITIFATRDISILSIMTNFGGVMSQIFTYHLFSNLSWEEMKITLTIVNQDTGYVVAQAALPKEAFEYTPEDWETSKTRDIVENPLPYQVEGYSVPGPLDSSAASSLSISSVA